MQTNAYSGLAKILRLLGDDRRLRILRLLMRSELCVCELVEAVRLPQYEVSRHLAALKNAGLVEDRRDGLWAYYSVPETAWKNAFLSQVLDLVRRHEALVDGCHEDDARLERRLDLRVGGLCVVGVRDSSSDEAASLAERALSRR